MKNDNILLCIVISLTLVTLVITSGLLGYQWGIDSCEPLTTETYVYDLQKGSNGILRFTVDQDNLTYVIFVQENDTFALDALTSNEFDSLVNVLYTDTL